MPGPLARRASDAAVRVFLAREPRLRTVPLHALHRARLLDPGGPRSRPAAGTHPLLACGRTRPFDRAGTECNSLRTGTEGRLEGVFKRAGGAAGPEPRYRGHGVCEILGPCPKQGDRDRPLLSSRALPARPPGGRGFRQTSERAERRGLHGSRDQGENRQVARGGRVPKSGA